MNSQNNAANGGGHQGGNQYPADPDNLKSYISDLKKAAIGNKKSRGNASHSRGGLGGAA